MGRLTRDELLVLLIEECGEVIQAATKCLRFGFAADHGIGYGQNDIELSKECGDVLAVIAALPLSARHRDLAAAAKITKAEKAKEKFGRNALDEQND